MKRYVIQGRGAIGEARSLFCIILVSESEHAVIVLRGGMVARRFSNGHYSDGVLVLSRDRRQFDHNDTTSGVGGEIRTRGSFWDNRLAVYRLTRLGHPHSIKAYGFSILKVWIAENLVP